MEEESRNNSNNNTAKTLTRNKQMKTTVIALEKFSETFSVDSKDLNYGLCSTILTVIVDCIHKLLLVNEHSANL